VVGDIDDGAPRGIEPGIALGIVVEVEGGGGVVPAGTLIGGSIVLGIDDGEIPLGDTVLGTDCGDCPPAGLPRLGREPDDWGPPRLPRLGTDPGDCPPPWLSRFGTLCGCGRPVCANTGGAGMTRTKATSVHTYLMRLHIRNRGATMPR
jgi:hypothetical protein